MLRSPRIPALTCRLMGVILLVTSISGCSSLGLSCFPNGHFLTDQAEAILDQSPSQVQLPRELDLNPIPAHYLQAGDQLLVDPVDIESGVRMPADQRVMIDGTIDLGGFGRIQVTGLTLEMTEELIERAIVDAGEEQTRVNVRLLEPVHRYYVLGEVNSPGSYPLVGNETVLDGIVSAGGLTSAAASCKILLARPTPPGSCRVTLPICYREIAQLGDTTTNYQLQPGDRIFVASRTWCEELMFWRATTTCARCASCQTACFDPAMATSVGESIAVDPQVATASLDVNAGDLTPSQPMTLAGGSAETEPAAGPAPATAVTSTDSPANLAPVRIPPITDPDSGGTSLLIDGQLDFDSPESSERFEPLWITPSDGGGAKSSATSAE